MRHAGKRTERITLQTSTPGKDAVGGPTDSWADVVAVWSAPRVLSARQIQQAQQSGAAVRVAFEIDWRSGIGAAQRVRRADGSTVKVGWVEEYRAEGRIVIVCEDLNG